MTLKPRPAVVEDYAPRLVGWLTEQASNYGMSFAQFAMQWISEHTHHARGPYWEAYTNQGYYDWIIANLWGQVVSEGAIYDEPELLCGNYAELIQRLYPIYAANALLPNPGARVNLVVLSARHSFDVTIDGVLYPSFQDHVAVEILEPQNGGRWTFYDFDYGVCYINMTGRYAGQLATLSDLVRPKSPAEFRAALVPWAGPSDWGWNNPRVKTPLDPNELIDNDFFASVQSYRLGVAVTNTRRVDPDATYVDGAGNRRKFHEIIADRLAAAGRTRGEHFEA